jgi:sugar O-acyltransferase (sialic acid O-acetyltransferase NeuD family)
MKIYGIVGAGGFGREVMHTFMSNKKNNNDTVFFIDENIRANEIDGIKVIKYEDFLKLKNKKFINIAISDYTIREKIYRASIKSDLSFFSIIANNVVIMNNTNMGDCCILQPFVTITNNVKIGNCFQANLYSYVGHDCIIGDFVTFAPSVRCNGNIVIENNVYLGTGVTIKQGNMNKPIVIGEGSIIGMNSIISKSIPKNSIVVNKTIKTFNKKIT